MNNYDVVAIYFYCLGAKGGGAERNAVWLANNLSRAGFEVVFFSLDAEDCDSFYSLNKEVVWYRLGRRTGIFGKIQRVFRMRSLLRHHGVRYFVGFVMSGDRTVYTAALLSNVKLIAAERNAPSIYRIRYTRMQRLTSFLLLFLCHRIIVQFENYRAGYPAALRHRICVIPNPVARRGGLAHPDRPVDGGYTLLAVGRLDEIQKNYACLLRAFALIYKDNPGWHLHIIGNGPDEVLLKRLITSLGLTGRVMISPTRVEIWDAYRSAHLFVMPSRWEGFPNALAEAMSLGLPAVGFADADGVRDLIGDEGQGWFAPGLSDEQALASVLAEAMSSPDERRARGIRASVAMHRYQPQAEIEKWSSLLCQGGG